MPPDIGAKVLAFLKEIAGTDPQDVRRKQKAPLMFLALLEIPKLTSLLLASSSTHTVRLDFDRAESVLRAYDSLGMLPKQREMLDQLKEESRRHGVVLIGGGQQSGITTTCYAIMSQQ